MTSTALGWDLKTNRLHVTGKSDEALLARLVELGDLSSHVLAVGRQHVKLFEEFLKIDNLLADQYRQLYSRVVGNILYSPPKISDAMVRFKLSESQKYIPFQVSLPTQNSNPAESQVPKKRRLSEEAESPKKLQLSDGSTHSSGHVLGIPDTKQLHSNAADSTLGRNPSNTANSAAEQTPGSTTNLTFQQPSKSPTDICTESQCYCEPGLSAS